MNDDEFTPEYCQYLSGKSLSNIMNRSHRLGEICRSIYKQTKAGYQYKIFVVGHYTDSPKQERDWREKLRLLFQTNPIMRQLVVVNQFKNVPSTYESFRSSHASEYHILINDQHQVIGFWTLIDNAEKDRGTIYGLYYRSGTLSQLLPYLSGQILGIDYRDRKQIPPELYDFARERTVHKNIIVLKF